LKLLLQKKKIAIKDVGLLMKKDYGDSEKAWLQKLLDELENEGFISIKKDVICFVS